MSWVPWSYPSVIRKQADGHRELETRPDFEKVGGKTRPSYLFERSIGGGSGKRKLQTAAAYAKEAIDAVVETGLLDYDIDQYVAE